ncbi:MAG: PAS domain-containing protein [Gammaproteobacteria bacterium]|nr:PAS domain-containing protein [Gammaproteobacteria bacterium]
MQPSNFETIFEEIRYSSSQQNMLSAAKLFCKQSLDGVLITTPDVRNPKILYANPKMCELTGYTEKELVGQSPKIFQGPKTRRQTIKRLKRDLLTDRPFHGSTVNYRKDGTEYNVEWKINPVKNEHGELIFYLSTQRDISYIKSFVAELFRSSNGTKQVLMDLLMGEKQCFMQQGSNKLVEQSAPENSDTVHSSQSKQIHEEYDLFDDFDLFGEGFIDSEANNTTDNNMNYTSLSAREFLESSDIEQSDLAALEGAIADCVINIELAKHGINRALSLQLCIKELHEFANIMFMLDEFASLADALFKLVDALSRCDQGLAQEFTLDILYELINDLNEWVSDIFVNQSAQDIHNLDASIISSAKQLTMMVS